MPMDRASRRRSRTPSRSGKCDGAACIPSVVLAIGLAVSVASTVHAAPSYTATPLGTIGGNGSYAWAINASGEVTGSSYYAIWIPPYPGPNESKWHAFAYSGGVMRDLGSLGGPSSAGTAINDSGQIAGFSSIFVGQQFQNHPVLFANGTTPISEPWAGLRHARLASMQAVRLSATLRWRATRYSTLSFTRMAS